MTTSKPDFYYITKYVLTGKIMKVPAAFVEEPDPMFPHLRVVNGPPEVAYARSVSTNDFFADEASAQKRARELVFRKRKSLLNQIDRLDDLLRDGIEVEVVLGEGEPE